MNKIIATIAGLLLVCSAHAAPCTIRVLSVFDQNALNWMAGGLPGYTKEDVVQSEIDYLNASLANSGMATRVVSAGVISMPIYGDSTHYIDTVLSLPGNSTSPPVVGAAQWGATNLTIMQAKDDNNADVVVMFADYQNTVTGGDVSGYTWGIGPNAHVNGLTIDAMNISNLNDAPIFAHEFAHMMGARHYNDTATSNGKGYYYAYRGTGVGDCFTWVTIMTYNVPTMTSSLCYGYNEYSGGRGGAHVCSAQIWCNDWSVDIAPYYPPATSATAYGISDGTGNATECLAHDTHFGTAAFAGTPMYAPTIGPGPDVPCTNVVNYPFFSNPAIYFPGTSIPTGTATANNAGTMEPNGCVIAAQRNVKLAPALGGH